MKAPLVILAVLGLSAALTACSDAQEDVGPDAATSSPPSASPFVSSSANQTPTGTPAAPPADWVKYTNDDLGFSTYHPARLVPRDVSSTSGPNPQWVIDFRDPADASYGIAVVIVENREGLSLADYVRMNVCDPSGPEKGGQPVEIAGTEGLFCWMEVMDDMSDRHVVFEVGPRIFDLQSTEKVSDADFGRVIHSFTLIPASPQ